MQHKRIGEYSKGSWVRPQSVSDQEKSLRYDLLTCKDPEEKERIKLKIIELQKLR